MNVVVSSRKKVFRLSKYIEGFYCKDEDSIKCIGSKNRRTVLDVLYKSYPLGKTEAEIIENQDIKEMVPKGTVQRSLTDLRDANFLVRDDKKVENTVKNTGRRVNKHDIENLNTVLNFENEFQFAPGYVKYNPEFLEVWNKLVGKNDQDEIYPLLMRLLRKAFTKIPELNNKEIEPITSTLSRDKKKMIEYNCLNCGVNHEARDFIRAILLRLIDQLEINDDFINFMQERHFFNDQGSNHYKDARTRSKAEAEALTIQKQRPEILKELSYTESTPKRDIQEHKRKEVIKLRIISIEKDTGKNEIPFFAMDAHRNWINCTVDSTLLTDDMIPDSMIECIPSEYFDDEDGNFLSLSKDDSYIKTIKDDESFPKPIELEIQGISSFAYHYCVVNGYILQKPEEIEIPLENGKTISLFYTTIGDATGQIKLQEFHGSTLNKLSLGDRIKVIGAMATYDVSLEDELLLHMNERSSIIKLPTVSASTIAKVYPKKEEFSKNGTVAVSKEQLKNGIHVNLSRLVFFKDYTEAAISISNDNTDDALELSEGDSSASQNDKHFAITDIQPSSLSPKLGFIKPNIPPRAFYNSGTIRFEPLDHTQNKAKFQFKIKRKPLHDSYNFTFDVNIAKINQK
jgi:hypothetical protein